MEISEAAPPAQHRAMRGIAFWITAAIVVALDQGTKSIVRTTMDRGESWPDWDLPFRFRHITNSGASFGILQGETTFLVVMTIIGLGAIYLYYRNPPFEHWIASIAIGMMLGGALGNFIDRVRVGRVTDFIDFDRYPSFNLADSFIFVGVSVLILGYLWTEKRRSATPDEDAQPNG